MESQRGGKQARLRKQRVRYVWAICWILLALLVGVGVLERVIPSSSMRIASNQTVLVRLRFQVSAGFQRVEASMENTWKYQLQKWSWLHDGGNHLYSARVGASVGDSLGTSASSHMPEASASVQLLDRYIPAQSDHEILHVPLLSQMPELANGCEVTSLAMLLDYAHHPVSKMTLAEEIVKDSTPKAVDLDGKVRTWGDPNDGFVGDLTLVGDGYAVNHGPIADLLNRRWPTHAIDLTGQSFNRILASVKLGHPVLAWTTINYQATSNWVTWRGPHGLVRATMDEHVVLIVGFDADHLFINDPLDASSTKQINRQSFIESWRQLGNQAVTYSEP